MKMTEHYEKMNPPMFEGTTDLMDADKWMGDMQTLLTFLGTGPIQSMQLAAISLKGASNKWWKSAHTAAEEAALTWQQFVECIERQYISAAARGPGARMACC